MDAAVLSKLHEISQRLDLIERALTQRPIKGNDNLLTVKQAAQEYKMSRTALYRLKAIQVKIGRRVRISREAMDRFMQRPTHL
jgi:hypothetical protein